MTTPYTWATVPVTGDYFRRSDGAPASGWVHFSAPQIVTIDGNIVVPKPVEVAVDANGHVAVALQATDDPNISPMDWAWEVRELIEGIERRYFIQVPKDGGPINLATVVPVDEPPAMTWWLSGASQIRIVATLPADPDLTVIYITTN